MISCTVEGNIVSADGESLLWYVCGGFGNAATEAGGVSEGEARRLVP